MRKTMEERFWEKVAAPDSDGCRRWRAGAARGGYGIFYLGGGRAEKQYESAHRVAYRLAGNEIPAGFVVDHLCRHPWCVEPTHLEAVTHDENLRRGVGRDITRARHARVTHCPEGHEYTPENTYLSGPGHRNRNCKTCSFARTRARRALAKEARQ